MKLINYSTGNGYRLGVVTESGIADAQALASALGWDDVPETMEEFVHAGIPAVNKLKALIAQANRVSQAVEYTAEDDAEVGPCVPNSGKIICVGLNYRKHAEETNSPIPSYPVLFNKFDNTIAAHGEPIRLPEGAREIDYEAELAIVIGRKAKRVAAAEALDYVLGYCNANDISARDLQMRTSQWALGKCCDGFAPIGPYLVTADEVGDPNSLDIGCTVNGEVRQQSNTRDMIFSCKEIIAYISEYMTLNPGDLILTGTPEGVIAGYPREKQVWLNDGDSVAVEIEKLGKLANRLVRQH